MTWTLTIPQVPPSGNVTKRMHWARYAKLMETWFWWVRVAPGFVDIPPPHGKRRLTATLYGRNIRDRENLFFSLKPVVDVLRPAKNESGIYKTGKKKGQPWRRSRIGHGLILEDDPAHLDLVVVQAPLPKGTKPHLVLVLEDISSLAIIRPGITVSVTPPKSLKTV